MSQLWHELLYCGTAHPVFMLAMARAAALQSIQSSLSFGMSCCSVGTAFSVDWPELLYYRHSAFNHVKLWSGCCTVGIAHPDAGDGLFLQGGAPVGAVVALYPGLVYEPMHYR